MEQTQTATTAKDTETLANLNSLELRSINKVIQRIAERGGSGYASHLMTLVSDYAETIRMIRALPDEPTERQIQELKEWADADLDSLLKELWFVGCTIQLFDECDDLWHNCHRLIM